MSSWLDDSMEEEDTSFLRTTNSTDEQEHSFDLSMFHRPQPLIRGAASWDDTSESSKKRGTPVRSIQFKPGQTPNSTKRRRNSIRTSPRLSTPYDPSALLYEPKTVMKRKPKRSLGTCTTAASSTILETTIDSTESTDTQDTSTNFRFTSFPASLPRISHAPRTTTKPQYHQNNTSVSSLNSDVNDEVSEQSSSLHGTPVLRTRLNFGSAVPLRSSEQFAAGDEFPKPRFHTGSFTNSFCSIAKNNSEGDEVQTESTAGLTPSRFGGAVEPAPDTPKEVQLHFNLDAAGCSPIPGIPEEEGESSSKSSAMRLAAKTDIHHSQESMSSGYSSARPMPDMHAFENNVSTQTTTSSDDSFHAPPSPRLLCPPTPVRTPAWAHNDNLGLPMYNKGCQKKIIRSNSLIATKVLATCSPQVLDGRASLENSVLEEGKSDSMSSGETDLDPPTLMPKFTSKSPVEWLHQNKQSDETSEAKENAPVSMSNSFKVISALGSGTFADVYKVQSKVDSKYYAIKRNRRQFRGKRDRDAALREVQCMQQLQSHVLQPRWPDKANYSLYLLFFFQAWQEDGHFFCQTELCCRDTCHELMENLRSRWNYAKTKHRCLRHLPLPPGVSPGTDSDAFGRLMPEDVIWKVCFDVAAGLSHIHSHGLVHNDIKPSNVFFVLHGRFGVLCKIGDFGMARPIGSTEDGQEGDQKYMAPELLLSGTSSPAVDIFSLGLMLYEIASNVSFVLPSEGPRWHELRNGKHGPDIPSNRPKELSVLLFEMISPEKLRRPSADFILKIPNVDAAGKIFSEFLHDYVTDVDAADKQAEIEASDEQTPRNAPRRMCSPPPAKMPAPPFHS